MMRMADSCVLNSTHSIFREAVLDVRMKLDRCFDGCLGVKFGGKTNLEQHVLHHVTTQWTRQFNRFGAKQRVAEIPSLWP